MNGLRGRARASLPPEGRIAYYLFQESGHTECVFTDNWIWALEE